MLYGSTFSSDVHQVRTDNVSPADVDHVNSIVGPEAGAEAVSVCAHREPVYFMYYFIPTAT